MEWSAIPAIVELLFAPDETWEVGAIGGRDGGGVDVIGGRDGGWVVMCGASNNDIINTHHLQEWRFFKREKAE